MADEAMAPDYANPTHWMFRPGVNEFWPEASGAGTADLFYVHPTTVDGPGLNQPFAASAPDRRTDRGSILRQISPFAPVCRVFAPRYRQATGLAFHTQGAAAEAAYSLAYGDVRMAFDHYLRHENSGRGIILCGHSQGALHVGRLLEEVVEACGMQRQMVAAYAIGIGFSEGLFGVRYRHVAPCLHPDQTGCLVSWNCFLAGADASTFLQRTSRRDAFRLGGATPGQPVCINPISFDARHPAMDAGENPGTMVGGDDLPLPPLVPGLVGARCDGGVAWISPAPDPAYRLTPLPGGNLHLHDISLFHAALQQDVARRAAAHAASTHGRGIPVRAESSPA